MWTSDFLEIDGIKYNLPVKTDVTRNFDLLDKYAKRTDNGYLKRKLIGVYKNYQMNFAEQTVQNYDEYNRLVDKLTEPVDFHTVKIGNYTFRCYISSVGDTLYKYKDGKEYYKNLTAKFTAEGPWRS